MYIYHLITSLKTQHHISLTRKRMLKKETTTPRQGLNCKSRSYLRNKFKILCADKLATSLHGNSSKEVCNQVMSRVWGVRRHMLECAPHDSVEGNTIPHEFPAELCDIVAMGTLENV